MLEFKRIESKEAYEIILTKHYAQRKPNISYAFGCFKDKVLIGVLTIGIPVSYRLCEGLLGKEYKNKVLELNRLCFIEPIKNGASQLVSFAMKSLKHLNLAIVSYADTAMCHNGYIYQASNFLYTGMTKQRTDRYTGDNKHSRYGITSTKFRTLRSSKHRYVYFTANKTMTKKYKQVLNYPILPYPKGNNKNYELGTKINQVLIPIEV